MKDFLKTLDEQRWDDHRFYHRSRINQTLHLISAIGFLVTYVLLFIDPAMAALVGWGISMVTRQSGHFFFEPQGYDHANQVTHEHKEAVKVGYNLRRKVVLLTIWLLIPVALWIEQTVGARPGAALSWPALVHETGIAWLALAIAGVVFRTVQLFFLRDVRTGLIWAVKIVTDPFHDVMLYWKAPLYLLRGQLIDPEPNKR